MNESTNFSFNSQISGEKWLNLTKVDDSKVFIRLSGVLSIEERSIGCVINLQDGTGFNVKNQLADIIKAICEKE